MKPGDICCFLSDVAGRGIPRTFGSPDNDLKGTVLNDMIYRAVDTDEMGKCKKTPSLFASASTKPYVSFGSDHL